MLKIKYIGFDNGWPDFKKNNPIIKALNDSDQSEENINEANVAVIGSFITIEEFNQVLNFKGKKILYISEPIRHLQSCYFSRFLFENRMFDATTGCIIDKRELNWYKHSLYRISFDFSDPMIFENVNRFVRECPLEKKFCALINRHDWGNCRVRIHERMSRYGRVDCPGALLNNMGNEEVNRGGIPAFLKNYLFYICCENFGNSHPGYVTEKLMSAALGGAIPIYYGKLDDHDRDIFNADRILIVDMDDLDGLERRVSALLNDPEELERFYRQDVFRPEAYRRLMDMDNNIVEMVRDIRASM
jgi:hypothetical protein